MNITKQVENILAYSKAARNSDKELQVIYMQKSGMNLTSKQVEVFRDMPSLETLRRIRQKLQEGGQYKADEMIAKERRWKSMRMQQMAPAAKPKTIEQIILPWHGDV